MLKEGAKIPEFKLPDQSGEEKTFNDLKGKKGLVIYAYPKDNTPGCTIEANDFSRLKDQFNKKGYSVAGISKDSVKSHCGFDEKYSLGFTLISDPDLSLLKPLGAFGEKKMYGKAVQGIIRSTFVFDSKGILTKVYPTVKAAGHAEAVLADLG